MILILKKLKKFGRH